MPTYWSLDLYMDPTSANGSNGRFEPNPTLSTATSPNGPWGPPPAGNTASHFTVNQSDFVRVVVFDKTNTLTSSSMQMAAVFGRDNANNGAGPKSSPFQSAAGHVNCLLPWANQAMVGGYNGWWTADWQVQSVPGLYRFLIYASATDNRGNQWQFGHDPEMDVSAQK